MAGDTLQTVVQNFQRIYSECDDLTAIRLAGRVHDELNIRLPLSHQVINVAATSGPPYSFDVAPLLASGSAKILRIRRVSWAGSATGATWTELRETSREQLEKEDNGQLVAATLAADTAPTYWYIWPQLTTAVLALWTAPLMATASATNVLHVYAQVKMPFAALSDTAPETLLNTEIYELGMAARYAYASDTPNYQGRAMVYERAVAREIQLFNNRGPFRSNAYPSAMSMRDPVI